MKDFIIIGCGSFGESIAKSLYSKGFDVMVIDKDSEKIQNIANDVTYAIQADAMDESTLKSLGIRNFDVAIVSMGSDLQASILITLLIKEMGVGNIIAKANSDTHAKVLYKIGADRVIFPERDMGERLAHSLVTKNILDYIDLDPNCSIVEINAEESWYNKTLKEIQLPKKYGINVVALKSDGEMKIPPQAEDIIKKGDIIIAITTNEGLKKLSKSE